MKKILLTAILSFLLLTACGTQAALVSSEMGSLPAAAGLALGILRLEGTDQAVTADQAAALLPLWQVYQSLTASDTAAQAELDALVSQIRGTLTADQIEAMQAMDLTEADLAALMSEQNISEASPAAASVSSSGEAQPPNGGMPPSDMGIDPSMTGGAQPVSSSPSGSDTAPVLTSAEVPSSLMNALVELLETRLGS